METVKQPLRHEKLVLGAMIRNKKIRRRLIKTLSANEFSHEVHRNIFGALKALEEKNIEDATPSVIETFMPEGNWGGKSYLDKLEESARKVNVDYHVKMLRWDHARFLCIKSDAPELLSMIKDPHVDPDDVLRHIRSMQEKLKVGLDTNFVSSGKGLASDYAAKLRARHIQPSFRSSGFKLLDENLTLGFARGFLTVIAGAPSMGKSSLMYNMALRQAQAGFKVLILPWESGIESAIDSLVAIGLHITHDRLFKRIAGMNDEDKKKIDDFIEELLTSGNIIFLNPPHRDVYSGNIWEANTRLLEWVENQISRINPDICYWDLFEKKLVGKRIEQIDLALEYVQEMAKPDRANVHMGLLHQIRFKDVEKREDQRPTREGIKGTGAYVEVADQLFGVYRPAVYAKMSELGGIEDKFIEILCLKQRRGDWPWKITYRWDGPCTRIYGKGRSGNVVSKQDPELQAQTSQKRLENLRKQEKYDEGV